VTVSIPTDSLEPGMVLAEPVFNRRGQILLSQGSTISFRHITVLKTWGIESVSVDNGETETRDPNFDKEIQKNALARIQKRLLWHPQSPLEEEIIFLAVQQMVQRSLQGNP
jgi:hypothetical protein